MSWMQTVSGKPFVLCEPRPSDVDFEDIAHALSFICRFAGHTRKFYSVAEHSCRVADLLPQPIKIYGLLHDAHEAYIGDITTPVKHVLGAETIKSFVETAENKIQQAIREAAGVDPAPHSSVEDAVKYGDLVFLLTERRDLMAAPQKSWGDYEKIVPLADRIEPWSSERAEWEFMLRLAQWTNPRAQSAYVQAQIDNFKDRWTNYFPSATLAHHSV